MEKVARLDKAMPLKHAFSVAWDIHRQACGGDQDEDEWASIYLWEARGVVIQMPLRGHCEANRGLPLPDGAARHGGIVAR